jgi:hypothetical protein
VEPIVMHSEVAALVVKGVHGMANLSPEDRLRFQSVHVMSLRRMEAVHAQPQLGSIDMDLIGESGSPGYRHSGSATGEAILVNTVRLDSTTGLPSLAWDDAARRACCRRGRAGGRAGRTFSRSGRDDCGRGRDDGSRAFRSRGRGSREGSSGSVEFRGRRPGFRAASIPSSPHDYARHGTPGHDEADGNQGIEGSRRRWRPGGDVGAQAGSRLRVCGVARSVRRRDRDIGASVSQNDASCERRAEFQKSGLVRSIGPTS